ncbi:MAG: Uncharacterised protein [Cellulomonadaceae bacterium TMED98]|nr:MAG: Uncharacterised protein [Cellulomonadaceae bacterium TMED98]
MVRAVPESVTTAPDVPVGQHVREVPQLRCGQRAIQGVELFGHGLEGALQFGEDIAVERVRRIGPPRGGGFWGVEGEEVIGAPQREQELAYTFPDSLFGDHQVAASNHRARHQEPAHRIGAVSFKHLRYVGIVAQRLRHFLTV